MAAKMVVIRHPGTGLEYAILPKDFTRKNMHPDRKSYAEKGYVIHGYEDGSPYDGPKSQREIDKAAEAKTAPESAPARRTAPDKGKAS